MSIALKVIYRCLVVEFYKQNAAFFGLLFIILFGFIKSSEHIAIGSFLVANPSSLIFLYLLWFAYLIKVYLFVAKVLHQRDYHFLELFNMFSRKTKAWYTLLLSFLHLLPILLYGLFLIVLSINTGALLSLLSIVGACLLCILSLSMLTQYRLMHVPQEKIYRQFKVFDKILRRESFLFPEWLFRSDFILFFLSKFYTCIVLIGAASLYMTDNFDLRVYTTGTLLAFSGNVALLVKYNWFRSHRLQYFNSFPQPFFRWAGVAFMTLLLLSLPEMIVLIRHFPIEFNLFDVLGLMAFGIGINVFLYALLMIRQIELNKFIVRCFWLIVISTFFVLFSVHPWILGGMLVLISLAILYFRRFKFEFVEQIQ